MKKEFIGNKKVYIIIAVLAALVIALSVLLFINHKNDQKSELEKLTNGLNGNTSEIFKELEASDDEKSEKEKIKEDAVKFAEIMNLSEKQLKNQLKSSVNDYSDREIRAALKEIEIDFNKSALGKAHLYKALGKSEDKIIETLTKQDGFTKEQAKYAVKNLE